MDQKKKHLIIGSGVAAIAAVRAIRSVNAEDSITLVTREDALPYSPAVVPYLLSGRTEESRIAIADETFLEAKGCSVRRSKEVIRVGPEAKEIVYADGESEQYDTLLIASGSEPTKPAIAGLEESEFIGCHTVRATGFR
jgi:phenylglyoxylate dehydrogenase epsilon subunit